MTKPITSGIWRSRTSARARVVALIAAFLVSLSTVWGAYASHFLMPESSFCDGTGGAAVGEGTPNQVDVNADVFRQAFSSRCPGRVSPTFQGTGDRNALGKLLDRSRDFGVSDIALSPVQKFNVEQDFQERRGRISVIHQIPLYVDGLAIGFNTPCLPSTTALNLRSEVLGLIFAGEIKAWNHILLAADNPGLKTCASGISLVKRAGFAGSTSILKDYLSKRNPIWLHYKQPERNQDWPPNATNFIGSADNDDGIASWITSTPGTIGYLQYNAALVNQVRMAALDNPVSGKMPDPNQRFIRPSPAGCAQAASTVVNTPSLGRVSLSQDFYVDTPSPTEGDWSSVSITDAPIGYPICNFGYWFVFGHWLNAYQGLNPSSTIRTIADYLFVALHPQYGQALLPQYGYTPLPPTVLKAAQDGVEALRYYGGTALG